MNPKITFIIPTIGRATLDRTINSLKEQNNPNWKAIVVFDGIELKDFKDDRVSSIKIPKTGIKNHAGNVRNFGMEKVETEWIGFVDDDDTLSPDYVDKFEEELCVSPDLDCVIFRMFSDRGILPQPNDQTFKFCYVGISFAIKKSINIKFKASQTEDFYYLKEIKNNNGKIIISPYVTYFVRMESQKQFKNLKYKRIIC